MKILIINAGSSSLKYRLFDMDTETVLAKGLCERIGIDGRAEQSAPDKESYKAELPLPDHASAIRSVLDMLTCEAHGVISSMEEIGAVGHRVVHGGEYFNRSVLVEESVIKAIEDCVPLAPLHNPPNLVGIRACAKVLPKVPQVAVFDTAFHQSMPKKAYLYALPYDYYKRLQIRRYGFHGTSHRYVSDRTAELLGKPLRDLKIITCHLGNGSSVAAVDGGISVDTTMGFTPLEGLPMGTRSGNIDPAIIEFLMTKEQLNIAQVVEILNKKSGMLGVSGVSSDFRDLHEAEDKGDKRAAYALEIFAYSVRKFIGAYAAAMNGCDALVFTAGVGENNCVIRERICKGLGFMGLSIDKDKNKGFRSEGVISTASSKGTILVVPTNEELVIARDTKEIVDRIEQEEREAAQPL